MITLFTKENRILKDFPKRTIHKFELHFKKNNIKILTNTEIKKINGDCIVDSENKERIFDDIFLVARTSGPEWLKKTNLDLDDEGFLAVNDQLRSISKNNIFGSGDIVNIDKYNLKKSGVYAVRQGDVLSKNLRNTLLKKDLKKFKPQRSFLSIISMGEKKAIASKYSFSIQGKWVWNWKIF